MKIFEAFGGIPDDLTMKMMNTSNRHTYVA